MTNPTNPEVAILNAALELPTGQRAVYLDKACADDPVLRQQVEALLQAHKQAEGFMEAPPAGVGVSGTVRLSVPLTEKAGDRIGRYKLLQQIGEGGCGVVYMAEQEQPVRRRVALKVIKLGMDTKEVIARFEAERQALALMDHPNIAKVLDAGATETGRPYFVMELVRGIKITEFCDENKVSTEERLKLFIQVCQAIQHAHQKGIIHRDIKPSNILVTVNDGVPVPKVIDFGIAKATQGRLTDKTLFTAFEQFMGTPAYMSPEQAVMTSLDIDTRSDIYSLGVLLYELLTGKTPFDANELLQSGLDAMRRTILETEPPKPSTRLSAMLDAERTATARHRQTESPKLIHLVRGDLDWIVMKSLEKDRARRYETANGFAQDIQRHLSNEPVNASPPGRFYSLKKAVRRNMGAFVAGTIIGLVLLFGVVASTSQAIRATRAEREQIRLRQQAEVDRKRAQTEALKSDQTSRFLKAMLTSVGPSVALGRDTTMMREILDQTRARIRTDLKEQPEVQIELGLTLARVYGDLSLFSQEEEAARETLGLARARYGEENLAVADALMYLGRALNFVRKLEEGETINREAIALQRKLRGSDSVAEASSLRTLCDVLRNRWWGSGSATEHGKLAEAETAVQAALAIVRKRGEQEELARYLDTLSFLLRYEKRLGEAEAASRESLAIRQGMFGKNHPEVSSALTWLSAVLMDQGKLDEAQKCLRQALLIDAKNQVTGWHHAVRFSYLAWILGRQGKLAEEEACLREVVAIVRKEKSEDDLERYDYIRRLAVVLRKNGKLVEAVATYQEALAGFRKMAEKGDVKGLNNAASLLATCPLAEIRDGGCAVDYGERGVLATKRQNPMLLDTLAASYAEIGEFAKAFDAEQEAIILAASETDRNLFTTRLRLYEAKSPFRYEY